MSSLGDRIAALRELSPGALRAEWRKVYRMPAPELSADLLVRGIAYRLQEKELGRLSPSVERRLLALAGKNRNQAAVSTPVNTILHPGTQLVRSWRGKTHYVVVTEDGFLWNGTSHASLSSIAQAITGTKWSGPRFFGLRGRNGGNSGGEKTRGQD